MRWPDDKAFAFTIVDDTDGATVENVAPVYELLAAEGIGATKTVWVEPSRDGWAGQSLADPEYLDFIRRLQAQGFEIALHGVGSGSFTRAEIVAGLDRYRQLLGRDARVHTNHSRSVHNVYWGARRFVPPVSWLYRLARRGRRFEGDDPASPTFWGDRTQGIDYVRNHVFGGIDTLRADPRTPYRDDTKPYSRSWFSSSDGEHLADFTELISRRNVDALVARGSACIVYTHFASGFVHDGQVDPEFAARLRYLARQDGWFVPASQLLDHLRTQHDRPDDPITYPARLRLDTRWLIGRLRKRISRSGRGRGG